MEAFAALLEAVTRILVAGFAAAPLAWVLAALLLLLGLAGLALRRRPVGRNEVETVFLASAAATRKAREIGEIDAFARRAGAAADELKAQLRRLRAGHHSYIKVYVDHSNFIKTWNSVVHGRDRPLAHDIAWQRLSEVLLDETGDWLTRVRKAPQALLYRGMHVYGTLFEDSYFTLLETMLRHEQSAPHKLSLPIRLRKETIDKWREENEQHKIELTREIGNVTGCVVVPIYRRTPREDQLASCQYTSGGIPIAPEKMLDTFIATDLVGDATFDAYDIALIVSEDSDFVPAVEFVQEMRTKQVVHVGFGSHSNDLRAACRHRIDLAKGDMFRRLQRTAKA
ncbi:MAG: NYN domain-containing protein [Hyphomonadaceae bacterium]|nr:NYN domain-containing protein [Hyphomonadaceae bacterium]